VSLRSTSLRQPFYLWVLSLWAERDSWLSLMWSFKQPCWRLSLDMIPIDCMLCRCFYWVLSVILKRHYHGVLPMFDRSGAGRPWTKNVQKVEDLMDLDWMQKQSARGMGCDNRCKRLLTSNIPIESIDVAY
jgi:hypothetical protein